MSQQVKEAPWNVVRRVFRDGIACVRGTRGAVAACAVVTLCAGGALAQPAPAKTNLAVNIQTVSAQTQRVIVPLRGSAIVETTEPISRVEVIESAIASIRQVTPKQFIVTGAGYGITQVILWTESGEREMVEVQVELDLAMLNDAIREIDPQSSAEAKSLMGNIILSGTVSGPDAAEQIERMAALFVPRDESNAPMIQNHLRVSGEQQVLLRCTVAEVNRTAMRRLGVNGFLAGDDFQDAFVVNQIGGINPANIGAAADFNVQGKIPFLTGNDGIPLQPSVPLSIGFPRVQMQLFLNALAENSLLKILAEPNLVTVSGETASFLAGGEFPIPVPQSGAATGAITIDFREFGVRVNFTPAVLAHQRIRLEVAPEVSETDFTTAVQIQGFVVPGLTQRRVETTVEVGNGQTIAVAGLLSEEIRGLASRIPALGDVPVLGALFRSVEYQRRQTELVILVTPEIIAPMNPQQVPPVPGEDYVTPNDFDLYALGLLEGEVQAGAEEEASSVYQTDSPVIVAPLKSEPEELSIHGPWGYSTGNDM